jgi:hypothetical protein
VPTLRIQGIDQPVTVGDEFLKLDAYQQQKWVDDFAAQHRAEPGREEMLAEAYKRGLLPPDQKAAYEEAQKRGLVGGTARVAQEITGNPLRGTGFGLLGLDVRKAASNILPGIGNAIKGTAETAGKAALAVAEGPAADLGLIPGQGPVGFMKDLAINTYEGLKQRYAGGLKNAIEENPVGVILDVLTVAGGLRGVGARSSAEAGLTPAASRATTEVAENLAADRGTPADLKTVQQTRPGVATPMDIGGENTLTTVERLANTSKAAPQMREFLTARQEGQLDRISNDLVQLSGTNRSMLQATKETIAQRQQAASPAYKRAYEAGDREIAVSDDLLSAPSVKRAMRGAISQWQDNAVADGYGAMNPTQVGRGGLIKFNKSIPAFPNVQFWDYTKRALDRMIDGQIRPDGSMTSKGRDLTVIKNKLVSQLDAQVGEYRAARASWAGPTEYIGALRDGADILKKGESAEQMRADFNALSEGAKQGYREAAVSSIIHELESNPNAGGLADLTSKLKSPAVRKKILAMLPDDAARRAWNQKLNFEIRSSKLVAAGLKNSATARRVAQAAQAESLLGDMVLGTAKAAVTGGFHISDLLQGAIFGFKRLRDSMRASTDREMVNILSGKPPTTQAPPAMLGGKPTLGASRLTPAIPLLTDVSGSQQ